MKALPAQACQPEFSPPNPRKKPGMMMDACNLSTGVAEKGGSLELTKFQRLVQVPLQTYRLES